MYENKRITVWEGDITSSQLDLSPEAKSAVATSISLIIHCASSINLRHSLTKIAPQIIYSTLELSKLALSSKSLKRFVYVSSAYANGHLHQLHDGIDTEVLEQVYPLRNTNQDTSALELADLTKRGTSPEYTFHNFPAAYAYAKHLTERLLLSRFHAEGRDEDLLIIRPSIMGPAMAEPVPGFHVQASAPATALCAAILTCWRWEMRWASRFPNPEKDCTLDEVPIDVVVNRLLVHTAKGSSGCVHAVAGKQRLRFADVSNRVLRERRLPWWPRMRFQNVDWHSETLSPIARMFTVVGTSFLFDEAKTVGLWARMSAQEQKTWPLFLCSHKDQLQVATTEARRIQIKSLIRWWLEKKGLSRWMSGFVLALFI